jgi:O-antigen/teichoic acid export membrane protein
VAVGGIAGMATAWSLQRFARRPSLELEPVRPLIGFGAQVSVLQGIFLFRELGFVSLVAAFGGVGAAGFYAMAKRLFSFPIALSSAVARVSFPALAREPRLRHERAAKAAAYTAIAAGLPLALVAGAIQPLIGVVLGDEWKPTADVVLYGSLGMMLIASAVATLIGLSLAEGRPRWPMVAAVAETTVAFATVAALTGPLGEIGVGLALSVSAVVAVTALAIGTDPGVRRSMLAVAKATAIAAVAVVAGQAVGAGEDIAGLLLSLGTVGVVWFALELVFSRSDMTRILGIIRPLLRRAAPI